MRYAIIENGLVVNVAWAEDAQFAADQGWLACDGIVQPGDLYDGTNYTRPEPVVPPAPVAPTKEELLAQLQALQAQIMALE